MYRINTEKNNPAVLHPEKLKHFILQYRTVFLCTIYPKIIAWKGIKKYTEVLMKAL